MFKFDLHCLGFEYNKYWHDIKKQLELEINAHIYTSYDSYFDCVKVLISLKAFNYNTAFYFPSNIKDDKINIIKLIKENLRCRIYESVFYIDNTDIGG